MKTVMKYVVWAAFWVGWIAGAQTKPAASAPDVPSATSPAAKPAPQSAKAAAPPASTPAKAQQPDSKEMESAMAESLAQQRKAAMEQVASVMGKDPTPAASFFTVPW